MSIVSPDFQKMSSRPKFPEKTNNQSPKLSHHHEAVQSSNSLHSVSLISTTGKIDELAGSRHKVLNQYLEDTKLLQVLNSWVLLISGLEELPYNPYPTLAWYARRHAERFHMFKEDEDSVLDKILSGAVHKTGAHVSRTQDSPPWWGLHFILKAVSPKALEKFLLVIAKCSFSYPEFNENQVRVKSHFFLNIDSSLCQKEYFQCMIPVCLVSNSDCLRYCMNYNVSNTDLLLSSVLASPMENPVKIYVVHKPVAVLVGPCVFIGSLYPDVSLIQIRLEHGISGPLLKTAVKIFSFLVLHGINMIQDDSNFVLLEIFVPKYSELSWFDTRWTFNSIMQDKEEFRSLIQMAATNQKLIAAECLFRLTPGRECFRRGEIQFNLNFIKVQSERTTTEASIPFRSAYEGVFSSHSSLISYLAWFENVRRPEHTPEFHETTSRSTKKSGSTKHKPSLGDSASMYVPPSRIDLDCLSTTTDSTVYPDDGPYACEVQDNIRDFLRFMISSLPKETDLFPMLHYVILSQLVDQEGIQDGLLEAARLLRSNLYFIHLLISENSILQELITWFSSNENDDSFIVQSYYLQFRQSVKNLFCYNLKERSSAFTVAGKVLLDRLDALAVSSSSHACQCKEMITLPLNSYVLKELQSIKRYCTTLMLGLLDDVLAYCPTLRRFPSSNSGDHSSTALHNFQHGVELSSTLGQRSMYMNREQAKKTISSPSYISDQATILKYFIDAKVDQTFQEFLCHVLNRSSLPPNPYPSLVTHLCSAAIRMELFGEKQEKLLSRLVPGSCQIIDTQNHIYSCPGSDAFGVKSAVSCLDIKCYNALLRKLSCIRNTVSTRVTDAGIKATIGLALTGFTPFYGRMMPYIHHIELEEHYFLQGPINAKMDVINYFSRLVYDHLVGIAEESSILFVGLFFGHFDGDVRRSLIDIVPPDKKISCLSQLVTNIKNEKPVYMKAYILMDWRLVLVKKSFLLHYIQGQFQGYQRFFKPRVLSYYQNVFSCQSAASLFARACGPQDKSDPLQGESLRTSLIHVNHYIERAKCHGDFLNAYRWMLMKSLMCQSTVHVAQAWYMSHSAAAQLEYLMILNDSLQTLVYEELSRTFAPFKDEKKQTDSLLDMNVLGDMMQAFCQKLDEVLQRGTCMTPSGLLNILHEKFCLATEKGNRSNSLQLKITEQTPMVLQSINEFLQPLLHSSANDIHQVCRHTDVMEEN
ncbi:uncharacterized protein LOC110233576 isoform X2 [Exaiptasia diaphana]|uniref:Uncharacterized protein n=1 Tax=Exaiptasia diaphana TaxID=2652724 RepID=A0A913YE50_EXADI|nr:uncharacterized protein LOC110233576 isoform X2 [Exaiptasia diaphana]